MGYLKYIPKFLALAIIAFSVFALWNKNKQLHEELLGKTEKYKQLSNYVASLEIKYTNQKGLNKAFSKEFSKEKKHLKGRAKIFSNVKFLSNEKVRKTPDFDIETSDYVLTEITYKNGPPIGYVALYKGNSVQSKIYDHEIEVKTLVGKDDKTGRYTILSKSNFILKEKPKVSKHLKWVGEPFALKIVGGTATINPLEKNPLVPKWQWFAPHLNAHLSFGESVSAGLGVSFLGYGVTDNDLKLKFLDVGVVSNEKDNTFDISIIPVSWRALSPVLNNTYLGVGYNLNRENWVLDIGIGL